MQVYTDGIRMTLVLKCENRQIVNLLHLALAKPQSQSQPTQQAPQDQNTLQNTNGQTKLPRVCQVSPGNHDSLVYCPHMMDFVSYGSGVKAIHQSVCIHCLSTRFKDPKNCQHLGNRF